MQRNSRDIDEAQQRVKRYWYEDGLTEIAAGFLFVLVGLLFLAEASAPAGSLPPNFSAIGLPILIIVGVWLANRVIAALKERLTYQRTGYVAYHRPGRVHRLVTVLVALVTAGLATLLLRSWPASEQWIPAVEGLSIAIFLLYLAHTLGLPRFSILALASAIIGVAAALGSLSEELGTAIYFCAMGVCLLVSGGLTLRNYLSRSSQGKAG